MRRVLQGVTATLSQTVTVDGTATNPSPDSATVTITRADGTALVTDATATEAGTGVFTYTLTPTQTAVLGVLDVTWHVTIGGQTQTLSDAVEVVGGFYFTISEFYARYADVDPATYTPAKVADARETAETTIEDETGIVSVPRGGYVSAYGAGKLLTLPGWPLRSVTSVLDSDGAEVDLTYADVQGDTVSLSSWPCRALTVSYEYGRDRPKSTVKTAAMVLTRELVVSGPLDNRATQISSGDGGTINLSTPGLLGAITGIPYVDQVIRSERLVSV